MYGSNSPSSRALWKEKPGTQFPTEPHRLRPRGPGGPSCSEGSCLRCAGFTVSTKNDVSDDGITRAEDRYGIRTGATGVGEKALEAISRMRGRVDCARWL